MSAGEVIERIKDLPPEEQAKVAEFVNGREASSREATKGLNEHFKKVADDIRAMRNRTPFRPFQIHLTNGEVLPVRHPETMSLPGDDRELFVVWTEKSWNLADVSQVVRMSSMRKNKSGS
jgi:hypothetical protein